MVLLGCGSRGLKLFLRVPGTLSCLSSLKDLDSSGGGLGSCPRCHAGLPRWLTDVETRSATRSSRDLDFKPFLCPLRVSSGRSCQPLLRRAANSCLRKGGPYQPTSTISFPLRCLTHSCSVACGTLRQEYILQTALGAALWAAPSGYQNQDDNQS